MAIDEKRLLFLSNRLSKKRREELDSGIGKSGRRSAFEEGKFYQNIVGGWGGLSRVPQWMKDVLPKRPKTKGARKDFDLGIYIERKMNKK